MAEENDIKTNNDVQNITHKTEDRVTLTPLKTGGELMCSGMVSSDVCLSRLCFCTVLSN